MILCCTCTIFPSIHFHSIPSTSFLHMCSDLPGVLLSDDTQVPLLFVDTVGTGLRELETGEEDSKGNEGRKGGWGGGRDV